MSVRLLLLGLIKDHPLHGYEIKRIVETRMADWSHVATGSIYFALEKLGAEGFLEASEPEREGNRPSRRVFRITEHGKTEFLRLLRGVWANPEPMGFTLDFGLAFMESLEPAEIRTYLQKRITSVSRILEGLALHEKEEMNNPHVPRVARFIFSHHEAHYRAEHAWLTEVLLEIE